MTLNLAKNFGTYTARKTTILSLVMNGVDFKEKRERLRLSVAQVAERLKVSTATVRNWETEATPIPTAVELLWEVWEPRFRQEDPLYGPLTLIYSDGPMFIDPQGPRQPLAMMQQEPYLTNAAAIARVGSLWGRECFHNPLIIDRNRDVLWNSVQLERVAAGRDTGAPTIANLIRAVAAYVMTNSAVYVRTGPRLPDATEIARHRARIEDQAGEIAALAEGDPIDQAAVEAAIAKLGTLGQYPPSDVVAAIASGFHARSIGRA
jgi:DNA-binding transcriptional regulator YiaG